MEVVGKYLSLRTDTTVFADFWEYWTHFFLALPHLHRTTFARQTANLQTFYGFCAHVRLCLPVVITRICLVPAIVSEVAVPPDFVAGTSGTVLDDRNYWLPPLPATLRHDGLRLLAPCRWASRDPHPHHAALLYRVRYRIDTAFAFGQLAGRCAAKHVWAHDTWHLWGRLLHKVLFHTLAVHLNLALDQLPLRLSGLVA